MDALHTGESDLIRVLDGACEPEERAAVEAHLGSCAACADRAATLRGRAARLARVLAEADSPAPGSSVFPAARLARARARRAALRWRVAAAAILALSGTLAVRPVRAWIVEAARAIWTLPARAARGARPPAPAPPPADTAGAVVFTPSEGAFGVAVASRQAAGVLVIEAGEGPSATAAVVGDRDAAELLVLPDGLRIGNRPDATASYLVRVPAAARVVVRVAGGIPDTLRPLAAGERRELPLAQARRR